MNTQTKILIVEHDPNDIELIQYELKKGKVNYIAEVVQTGETYENALRNFVPDIILSDYSLPAFDGPTAFKMREKIAPDTPFIFVSGTIGEENSIELIKNGVTDYALKDNLLTLTTKVKRALKESKEKQQKIKTEHELEQSERQLAKAQEVAHLGSWELDFATGLAIWSKEACRIYGVAPGENEHTFEDWLSFIHPEDLDFVLKKVKEARHYLRDNSFYHRIVRKDGAVRHICSESKFKFNANGKPTGLYGIEHDVTEIKLAEESLRQSETNLRAIFENTGTGFLLLDTSFNIISFNKKANHFAKGLVGFELQEKQNLIKLFAPERQQQFVVMFNETIKGANINYEANYPQLDGTAIWYSIKGNPVSDTKGKVVGICVAVNDITEQKRADKEIRELNEKLEERVTERTAELTEANKALEAFNSMVSHDLRSPARAVTSFAEIIQQEHGETMKPEVKELFGFIEDSGHRMNAIIDDLLKLAKYGQEKLKLQPVNMTRLVNGIWLNISRNSPHGAILELDELCDVKVDMSMMEQVIVNLLSNATKYSAKKENPVIKVWSEQTEENCTYYFKDNGAGFDMKNYNRLFGAFQRLHNARDFAGTGVGLTLVKRIIEKHRGTVGAEGKVGEGATFWFTIPK